VGLSSLNGWPPIFSPFSSFFGFGRRLPLSLPWRLPLLLFCRLPFPCNENVTDLYPPSLFFHVGGFSSTKKAWESFPFMSCPSINVNRQPIYPIKMASPHSPLPQKPPNRRLLPFPFFCKLLGRPPWGRCPALPPPPHDPRGLKTGRARSPSPPRKQKTHFPPKRCPPRTFPLFSDKSTKNLFPVVFSG